MSATASEKLLRDLEAVVADAEALLQATAAQSGDKIDSIRARARESLGHAKSRLHDAQRAATAQVREAADTADDYVRKNPWQAVGVAAGAGLLLGLLLGRR